NVAIRGLSHAPSARVANRSRTSLKAAGVGPIQTWDGPPGSRRHLSRAALKRTSARSVLPAFAGPRIRLTGLGGTLCTILRKDPGLHSLGWVTQVLQCLGLANTNS